MRSCRLRQLIAADRPPTKGGLQDAALACTAHAKGVASGRSLVVGAEAADPANNRVSFQPT